MTATRPRGRNTGLINSPQGGHTCPPFQCAARDAGKAGSAHPARRLPLRREIVDCARCSLPNPPVLTLVSCGAAEQAIGKTRMKVNGLLFFGKSRPNAAIAASPSTAAGTVLSSMVESHVSCQKEPV